MKETLESPDIVQLLIDKGADVDNPTDVRCYCFTLTCSLVPRLFSHVQMKIRIASDRSWAGAGNEATFMLLAEFFCCSELPLMFSYHSTHLSVGK